MDFLKFDKNMFISMVNMKLRDEFSNIEDLCLYFDISMEDFNNKLEEFNLKYYNDINQVKNL